MIRKNWWLLQFNAKETRSQVKIFPDWLEQGIDVNADFINLTNQSENEPNQQANKAELTSNELLKSEHGNNQYDGQQAALTEDIFDKIPKLNFYCERCQVNNLNLGKVSFSLSRTDDNVIKIENFKAKREQAEFTFSGEWKKNKKQAQ